MRNSLPNRTNQKGMTLVSWLFLMALIGFIVLIVLRMFPIYTNHYKIEGVLHSLADENSLYSMNREELLQLIDRKLNINMASGFKHEHFTITLKENGNKVMAIKYEDRRNITGNIDVVVKFEDSIIVPRNGAVIVL